MNLINELHEGRYTVERLSSMYYEDIMKSLLNFRSSGMELTEDSYEKYSEQDARLFHVPYNDFKELMELREDYDEVIRTVPAGRFSGIAGGVQGDKIRVKMNDVTNKALIRRLSQDMCEDVKSIFDRDYRNLCKLGYLGEIDEAVPELVRGNFFLYAKREILNEELSGCNEAIDRMRYVLRRTEGKKNIELDKNAVERYFVSAPISSIRRGMAKMDLAPTTDYREKYLSDFHEEGYQRMKNGSMDVENNKGKKIKKMMSGNEFVTEEDYRYLSKYGYDGKTDHPMIRSGYKLYSHIYVLEKTKDEQLDEAKRYYRAVCRIQGVKEYLESPEYDKVPDSFNCMTYLRDDLMYALTKSGYKKGNISKEEYDEVRQIKELDDWYAAPIRLAKMISGVDKISFDNRKDIGEK